jgi:hypothetical protein
MKLFLVIMNHRRIHRARFLAFPLLIGTLRTYILDRLGQGKQVSVDPNPRQLAMDQREMFHAADEFTGATSRAEIPSRLNQGNPLGVGNPFHTPPPFIRIFRYRHVRSPRVCGSSPRCFGRNVFGSGAEYPFTIFVKSLYAGTAKLIFLDVAKPW